MVNLVEDREVLHEYASDKQGYYQVLSTEGVIEALQKAIARHPPYPIPCLPPNAPYKLSQQFLEPIGGAPYTGVPPPHHPSPSLGLDSDMALS